MSIEPHITALVRADGTGEVFVDGETFPVFANDIEGVRAAIIDRVTEEAVARDRPVRVATTDLDGVYPLVVHPDGAVDADGPIIPVDADGATDTPDGAHAAATADDAHGADAGDGAETDTAETDAAARESADDAPSDGRTAASDAAEDRGWRLGDDTVVGYAGDAAVDDNPVENSTVENSTVENSTVENSTVENSTVENSAESVHLDSANAADAADQDAEGDRTPADETPSHDDAASEPAADPTGLDAPRQAEPTLIPPPPFGIDGLVAPDDAPDGFLPSPSRRSTFRSFDAAIGFADETPADSGSQDERLFGAGTEPLDGGRGIFGADTMPDDSTADGAGWSEPSVDGDPAPEIEPALGTPALSDPQLDRAAPGLDAFTPATDAADEAAPTLDDFLQSRPSAPAGPAKKGWQGVVRRITGGLISPKPGKAERAHRSAIERVQRSLKGPRTIVVLNPKGGAHKTTATLLLAATFGIHRGGSTLAWDNNETRGTLGWRAQPSRHSNTAVDLLRDLDKFADVKSARVGYLDNYVRAQGDAQFDVLASDEDAAASSTIDSVAFKSLHHTLSRFYRLLVIDTGNNMRASNWEAAVDAADQLVVVTTVNEETAASAAWLLDGLRQKGHQDKVSQAVTILSSPGDTVQPELSRRLHAHFAALTRVVLEVPYDSGFQSGGPLNVDVLAPQTREAWLQVTAAVADGL